MCIISQGFTEPENGQWFCSFTYLLTLTVMIISSSALLTLWVSDLRQHFALSVKFGGGVTEVTAWVRKLCVCVCVYTYVCMYVIIMKMYITGYGMKLQSFFHATPPSQVII